MALVQVAVAIPNPKMHLTSQQPPCPSTSVTRQLSKMPMDLTGPEPDEQTILWS